jgi:serine/threonine protein kinase
MSGTKTVDIETLSTKKDSHEIKLERRTDLIGQTFLDDYKIVKSLYISHESEVFLCEKKTDYSKFVLKLYAPGNELNDEILKTILSIDSSYLVKPIQTGKFEKRFYELMPYFAQGTLYDNLKKLNPDFLMSVLIPQLNEALHYLHEKNLAHNDIKPENIFIMDDFKSIKLGDFGITYPQGDRKIPKLTREYAAPEADERSTKFVDYFSFGLVIYHVAYGRFPFEGLEGTKFRSLVLDSRLVVDKKIDHHLRNLIYHLLDGNASSRADYHEIKRWLDDPKKIKTNPKMEEKEGLRIAPYDFNKKKFNFTHPLTEEMLDNYKLAKLNLMNGDIQRAIEAENKDLSYRLVTIKDSFKDDPDKALMLTLMTMNEGIPWQLEDGIRFHNYQDFVNYLKKQYPRILPQYVDQDLVLLFAENKAKESIQKMTKVIFNRVKNPKQIAEAIINLSNLEKETWYLYDRKFNSHQELIAHFWQDRLEINPQALIDSGFFIEMLTNRYMDLKPIELGITQERFDDAVPFVRYLMVTKLLNQQRYAFVFEKQLYEDFAGFIQLFKAAYLGYEYKKYMVLNQVFSKGTLIKIYQLSTLKEDEKQIKSLKAVQTTYDRLKDKEPEKALLYALSSLYFQFSSLLTKEKKTKTEIEDPVFIFDHKTFNSLNDIIEHMAATTELDFLSLELLTDVSFAAFLEYLGYDDAFIHRLKGEK